MSESSGRWDSHYKRHGRPWAGTIHNRPKLPGGLNILEAGCGNGKHLKELLYNDVHVTAFDFSASAVRECRNTLLCSNNQADAGILVADCMNLPFRDSVFDIAFYRHVTGHMKAGGRRRSADECTRVLKEGGELRFTGFSVEDLRAGKGTRTEENSYLRGNGIMTHYFTEEEVKELFFELEEVSVRTVRWSMRVRGTEHTRAEIAAIFKKVTR